MKKIIEEYYCDCCGKGVKTNEIGIVEGLWLDEDRYEPGNHPRRSEFYIYNNGEKIHLCQDCKKRFDMIKAYFINDMKNLFKENKTIEIRKYDSRIDLEKEDKCI